MSQREGDDVVQLLVDTGVLTTEDAAKIHLVQTDEIMRHMKEHNALIPEEEEVVQQALSTLISGGPLAKRLEAKIKLVGIITNNVHRGLERQSDRMHEQRERITGEAFPIVARLASKPK
jgi:hypothetical protein